MMSNRLVDVKQDPKTQLSWLARATRYDTLLPLRPLLASDPLRLSSKVLDHVHLRLAPLRRQRAGVHTAGFTPRPEQRRGIVLRGAGDVFRQEASGAGAQHSERTRCRLCTPPGQAGAAPGRRRLGAEGTGRSHLPAERRQGRQGHAGRCDWQGLPKGWCAGLPLSFLSRQFEPPKRTTHAGVRIKFDCKNGRCGTCQVRINGRSAAKVCQGAKIPGGATKRITLTVDNL